MSGSISLTSAEKAIGVGGGYPDQDHEVAEAVKAAL